MLIEVHVKKMDINISKLTKVIQKNFNKLSSELDIQELLDELHEQSLLCLYDYDTLHSKRGWKGLMNFS